MRLRDLPRLAAPCLFLGCGAAESDGPRVPLYSPEQASMKVPAQQELPDGAAPHGGLPAGIDRPDRSAPATSGPGEGAP